MKKISLILTFVLLMAALFAMSVFAASFTRGPEGETIAADDLAGDAELLAGSTHTAGYITLNGALDGNYSTWWGGPTGSKLKITFANEWEITSAEVILSANWCGCKISFYAADDTLLGSQSFGGYSANTGLCWGGDATNAARQDLSGAINKITYGDNDKAVKYLIFENTGDKWGYLPMAAEFILTGRERIPSVGCDSHEFAPVYTVEPGCTTSGTVINTCTKCGAEEAPATVPALGHNMGDYTVKVPATCTESPIFEYACTRCGEIVERPTHIKDVTDYADIYTAGAQGAGGYTTSHQALFDNNMESYLHASGGWYVESWIELDMPYYITSVTVWTGSWGDNNSWEAYFTFYYQAPGSDEWVAVSPTKAAGVIKAGEKYEHTLELAEPVYADAVKIKVDRLCSFQGQAWEAEVAGTLFPEVAPNGHTWEVKEVVAAACDAGYTLSECTVCGETKTDAYTKAIGHIWADATCTAPKTCTVCEKTEGDALGHSYFYECDKVCQVCNEESNPDATHTLVHVDAVAPTCTTNGNVEYWNCSICGYAWLDEACTQVTNQMSVVVPAAHSYFYECDKVCQVCFEETNPEATHTIVHVDAVPADCTTNGNVEYWYCSICNYAWLDEACTLVANRMSVVDPATGHEWDEGYFMGWPYPSCQNPTGTKTYTCNVCYETYDEENVSVDLNDVQWHNAELDWETEVIANCQTAGYQKFTCSDCGKVFEIVTEADTENGHEWIVDESVSYDATCIKDGYSKQTCAICNTTRELVLEKEFYGSHSYGYNPDTYVEATCQVDGYAEYTCELCGDSYVETPSAGAWLHEWVNSSNGLLQTCAVCEETSFGSAQLTGVENDLSAMFVWEGTALNIWNADSDIYYNITVESSENGVYVLSLNADDDAFGFNDANVVLTLVENGGTLVITTADETVYTLENKAPDYNNLINGVYATADGSVKVQFADGVATVLVNEAGAPLPETFNYNYNPMIGMIDCEGVYMNVSYSIDDDAIYFGMMPLFRTTDDVEPEEPVNYGDYLETIVVETTDTYGWFDLYTYTAKKAGQYSFSVPSGLGFYTKAMYETYAPAEVDFYENYNGEYVVINLAAGETVEFYIASTIKSEWEIEVYFVPAAHTHTEVEIPAILPTPSIEGYTAGIICSECGETLKAPVKINITEMANDKSVNTVFRVAAINLSAQENISVNFKALVTAGYNNPYAVFVFDGKEYMVNEYTIEASSGRYVFNFGETRPQLMAENITTYLYAETAEGEYTQVIYETYSVLQYILGQLKKKDPALTTVMSDILYMGAMTQLYMGVNTNKLVTSLAEAEGYTLTPTAFTTMNAANQQAVTGDRTTGTDWKAISLAFGASTEIVFKFETDNIEGLKVKVNVAGRDTYYDASELTKDGNRYVVYFNGARSYEYEETVTATFERDGVQVGSTFVYSINTFLLRNYQNTGKYNANAINLMKAIYIYGESIAKYFA